MYRATKGRKLPKSAYEEQPEEPVVEEEPAKKKTAKKAAKKPAEKAEKKPKKKATVKWSADYTKEDLYWIGQKLGIEKIKSRTPKAEMIKILRRHPDAEEKK